MCDLKISLEGRSSSGSDEESSSQESVDERRKDEMMKKAHRSKREESEYKYRVIDQRVSRALRFSTITC